MLSLSLKHSVNQHGVARLKLSIISKITMSQLSRFYIGPRIAQPLAKLQLSFVWFLDAKIKVYRYWALTADKTASKIRSQAFSQCCDSGGCALFCYLLKGLVQQQYRRGRASPKSSDEQIPVMLYFQQECSRAAGRWFLFIF